MSWARTRVGYIEPLVDTGLTHVVGKHAVRDCGCIARIGMRLDNRELTFTAAGCDDHHDETDRALFVFGHMPPSPREIFDVYEELLEREITEETVAA